VRDSSVPVVCHCEAVCELTRVTQGTWVENWPPGERNRCMKLQELRKKAGKIAELQELGEMSGKIAAFECPTMKRYIETAKRRHRASP
jgi:hypothetical protein